MRKAEGPGSAAFLQSVLTAVPAFIVHVDSEHYIRYINRLQPGFSLDRVIGSSFYDFMPPEAHERARACLTSVIATGQPGRYDAVGEGPNGRPSRYECHVAAVREADDRMGACVVATDVTAHWLRDQALRDSEDKLRLALEASGLGLWSWDIDTGEVVWDDRMRALCGRGVPLPPERYLSEVVHPDDRERVGHEMAANASATKWVGSPHRILRADGAVRWVLPSGRSYLDPTGRVTRVVGSTFDVTEQRDRDEQLRQMQKLDAIGALAAGMAHNFNNLLTIIIPTVDLLAKSAPTSLQELANDAGGAAHRAAELVRQLMTFAGRSPREALRARSIAGSIERAVAICRRTFDRHIRIEASFSHDLPSVLSGESELEQLTLNLLLNARDAILEAGRSEGTIQIRVEGSSRGACLRVRDDGAGMAPEVRSRVFEPFFTTKEVGKGTGLGLATCYAIVRELGGAIECESERGVGTTFSIYLPGTDAAVEKVPPAPEPGSVAGARVLLVDDEEAVRKVVLRLLTQAGAVVRVACDGREALARLAEDPQVDVVLLDRSMPGAPGEVLLPALRKAAPRARIVLFTGQGIDDHLAAQVEAVLHKPATRAELLDVIQAVRGR